MYKVAKAGVHNLTVAYDGIPLISASLQITASSHGNEVKDYNSTIYPPNSSHDFTLDENDQATIWVVVGDSLVNPLDGHTVTLDTGPDKPIAVDGGVCPYDPNSQMYSCTVGANRPLVPGEKHRFGVVVDGKLLDPSDYYKGKLWGTVAKK
ncbi:hypothetical protein [Bartonella sp. TP]|uniref:hypothetical protein n=1 Tax=Bartonella sp. TP TaxID=3057550 RepID=UPI0025AF3B6A|nr:hypothetical protein [Bartonella sp. TP]WJW79639.1 hypothetical protein QVL57_03720 [Bartonella sp. TP]